MAKKLKETDGRTYGLPLVVLSAAVAAKKGGLMWWHYLTSPPHLYSTYPRLDPGRLGSYSDISYLDSGWELLANGSISFKDNVKGCTGYPNILVPHFCVSGTNLIDYIPYISINFPITPNNHIILHIYFVPYSYYFLFRNNFFYSIFFISKRGNTDFRKGFSSKYWKRMFLYK